MYVEWLANYQTPPTGHLSFLAPRSVINAKFVMEIQVAYANYHTKFQQQAFVFV